MYQIFVQKPLDIQYSMSYPSTLGCDSRLTCLCVFMILANQISPCKHGLNFDASRHAKRLSYRSASGPASLALRICAILNSLAFQMLVFSQCHHGHRTGGALKRVT